MCPRPSTDDRRHPLQVRQPTQLYPRQLTVEILEKMPSDADREVVLLDERILEFADPALPVEQPLPRGFGVRCQRSRHREPGDDHVGKTVPCSQRSHYCSEGPSRLVAAKCQCDIVTTEAERVVDGVLVFAIPW